MAACALLGAATWHPDVRALTRTVEGKGSALGTLGWFGLLLCLLIGPFVVLFQVLFDRSHSLTSF